MPVERRVDAEKRQTSIVRMDTGEIVDTRAATDAELQGDLFGEDGR